MQSLMRFSPIMSWPSPAEMDVDSSDLWTCHLRVTSIDDLDDEVKGWLGRSYQVGCQLS